MMELESPQQILLASASPRRRDLLEAAGFAVVVQPPHIDETLNGEDIAAEVLRLAADKLAAVAPFEGFAVAADTVVLIDGVVLGKPASSQEAMAMLRRLSGKRHEVMTAFCVGHGRERVAGAVTTKVWFRELGEHEMIAYVASGEPYDKAGGYGIQGRGGAFIHHIEGSFTNVMGLPLAEVIACVRSLRR